MYQSIFCTSSNPDLKRFEVRVLCRWLYSYIMSHNSCDSYNLMTWAHKIQTTCKDNAILHRSFRHTEILVLSWRNIISPRSFWFHQESTHFTKSPSISPRYFWFRQDFFDFTKSPPISPSENFTNILTQMAGPSWRFWHDLSDSRH